jgi:predicted protein tyrosine phosphatase
LGIFSHPASPHHVCGLSELHAAPLAEAARIVSILDPGTKSPVELRGFSAKTLTLTFYDIVEATPNYDVLPDRSHIEAVLDFDRAAIASDRLVVHCHAGVSRSTASFVALLAQRRPKHEAAVFAELRSVRPCSWPNSRIIALADDILGTGGSLTRELRKHRKIMCESYPDLFHLENLNGA